MTVTVYPKPSCVQCNATIQALNKKGIDHAVIDVTEDQAAYDHVIELGAQQVPVVETETEHWTGYRPDKISGLST